MSQQSRAVLKTYFETGDIPTQAQFAELIDSLFNMVDDGVPAKYGFDTYAEVVVSSADILALGDGITLLAPPGSGKYYDWKVILEFNPGLTPYTFINDSILVGNYSIINRTFITGVSQIAIPISDPSINFPDTGNGFVRRDAFALNESLKISSWNGSYPTDGDGTILAKIWYNIRTFGSEL